MQICRSAARFRCSVQRLRLLLRRRLPTGLVARYSTAVGSTETPVVQSELQFFWDPIVTAELRLSQLTVSLQNYSPAPILSGFNYISALAVDDSNNPKWLAILDSVALLLSSLFS